MRRADLLIGIALVAFAVLYYRESFEITVGFAADRLGPRFFPRLLAIALAACGFGLIRRSLTGRSDTEPLPPVRVGQFLLTLTLTLGYAILLPPLGYPIATLLYVGALIWLLGYRNLVGLAATSAGVTAVLYLVFVRALHVLVPMGPLGR